MSTRADLIIEELAEIDPGMWHRLKVTRDELRACLQRAEAVLVENDAPTEILEIKTGDFIAAINQMLPMDLQPPPCIAADGFGRKTAQWKQEVNRHRRSKR